MSKPKSPGELLLDSVEMVPIAGMLVDDGSGLPYATHEGKLWIGGYCLDVVQLNTGQRLITEESLVRFFGGGNNA